MDDRAAWPARRGRGAFVDDSTGARHGAAYAFELLAGVTADCFGVDCPCNNDHPAAGCSNTTGSFFLDRRGGHLGACGSTRVAADDLELRATNIPAHEAGLIYMGSAAIRLPFGNGLRCVAAGSAGLHRLPVRDAGAAGTLELGPGIVAFSQASFAPGGHIMAGQSRRSQAWYRDPAGFCGQSFNLSSALPIGCCP